MTKQKITYQRMLSFALAFLLLFISIITLFPVTSNAASSHSNVMDDLKSDRNFDASKYPSKSDDVTVGVIHIAESTSGELYIYTYAPGNATKHRKANYINMSLQAPTPENMDSLQYKTYSLTWLSNSGVFDKYIVNGLSINKNDLNRYYNIAGIYRPYDSLVDSSSSSEAIDTVQCKSYTVGQYWKAYNYNGVTFYESKKIDVVEYKVYATGTVRYQEGFDPSHPFTNVQKDSHYVGFSITNWKVDQIIDADISYTIRTYQKVTELVSGKEFSFNEIATHTETSRLITKDQDGSNDGKGWFGKKYTWKRILTATEFVQISEANAYETFDAKESEGLSKSQYVFAFAETDWSRTQIVNNSTGEVLETLTYSEAENFGILRLKFVSGNTTYNLGAVGDLVGTDSIADLNVTIADNIRHSFEETLDWLKVILLVIGIILILVFLGGPLGFILRIAFKALEITLRILLWIISLPFKGIRFIFKRQRE